MFFYTAKHLTEHFFLKAYISALCELYCTFLQLHHSRGSIFHQPSLLPDVIPVNVVVAAISPLLQTHLVS